MSSHYDFDFFVGRGYNEKIRMIIERSFITKLTYLKNKLGLNFQFIYIRGK